MFSQIEIYGASTTKKVCILQIFRVTFYYMCDLFINSFENCSEPIKFRVLLF